MFLQVLVNGKVKIISHIIAYFYSFGKAITDSLQVAVHLTRKGLSNTLPLNFTNKTI